MHERLRKSIGHIFQFFHKTTCTDLLKIDTKTENLASIGVAYKYFCRISIWYTKIFRAKQLQISVRQGGLQRQISHKNQSDFSWVRFTYILIENEIATFIFYSHASRSIKGFLATIGIDCFRCSIRIYSFLKYMEINKAKCNFKLKQRYRKIKWLSLRITASSNINRFPYQQLPNYL